MKTAVPQVSHRGTLVEQVSLCSTCVPPAAGKTRRGGTPASPCPVSKIGGCSTWATKKQHTPASARHSPVVALCGLFPGGVETCPARTAEATLDRVAGTSRSSFFPAPVQFALWAEIPYPLDVGCGSRIKRRVITPAAGHTGRQSRPGKREFSEAFRPRLLDLHKESKLVKLHLWGVTPKPGSPDFSALSGV